MNKNGHIISYWKVCSFEPSFHDNWYNARHLGLYNICKIMSCHHYVKRWGISILICICSFALLIWNKIGYKNSMLTLSYDVDFKLSYPIESYGSMGCSDSFRVRVTQDVWQWMTWPEECYTPKKRRSIANWWLHPWIWWVIYLEKLGMDSFSLLPFISEFSSYMHW